VGAGYGGYSLRLAKQISGNFIGTGARYVAGGKNRFTLNLEGAQKDWGARLDEGRIIRHRAYRRGNRLLPDVGLYGLILRHTREGGTAESLFNAMMEKVALGQVAPHDLSAFVNDGFDAIEAMIADGWLIATYDETQPTLQSPTDDLSIAGPRRVRS
jgi:hypothetical protein